MDSLISVVTTIEGRLKSRTEFADRQQSRRSSPPDDCFPYRSCNSQSSFHPAANCDPDYRGEDLTLFSRSSSLTSTCESGDSGAGGSAVQQTCSNRRPAVIANAPTASSHHAALSTYGNNNNNNKQPADYDSSKYRDPDLVSFLRRRLLIMRLKERVMILLIAACCVLCVLFVIQSRISDDVIWEYPKKYK